MKHFAYFIAGILVASFTQSFITPAQAGGGFFPSMEEGMKRDRAQYQEYLACRDKNPKVVRYECLRLNPLGFKQL